MPRRCVPIRKIAWLIAAAQNGWKPRRCGCNAGCKRFTKSKDVWTWYQAADSARSYFSHGAEARPGLAERRGRRPISVAAQHLYHGPASNPVPFLQAFDAPDTAAGCARRSTTTVPTQALILLNDPFVIDQAQRFAERVRHAVGERPEKQVDYAFRLALGRAPSPAEVQKAVRFLQAAPLADLCQVLFQTNEFAYVD